MKTGALLLVDIQNDFMPGGPLPVPGGHEVVPVANRLQREFDLVLATQDWHPPDHGSFASNHPGRKPFEVVDLNGIEQTLWPDHCVQNTRGADLVGGLDLDRVDRVFLKGTDPGIDSYSGFYDNGHRKATGLGDYLEEKGVDAVYIVGVAIEFCVRFTALDATRLGFETFVVEDGVRGIELREGDIRGVWQEMEAAGVRFVRSGELG